MQKVLNNPKCVASDLSALTCAYKLFLKCNHWSGTLTEFLKNEVALEDIRCCIFPPLLMSAEIRGVCVTLGDCLLERCDCSCHYRLEVVGIRENHETALPHACSLPVGCIFSSGGGGCASLPTAAAEGDVHVCSIASIASDHLVPYGCQPPMGTESCFHRLWFMEWGFGTGRGLQDHVVKMLLFRPQRKWK